MNIEDYDVSSRYDAVVVETTRITPPDYDVEIRHIVLRTGEDHPPFRPGHVVVVLAPPEGEFGNREHRRFYTIASAEQAADAQHEEITVCVRRCFYIDDISGERYPGVASNFLCDARDGDVIPIAGPFEGPFKMPTNTDANLLMIGVGTGIAPFRAFIKHIYDVQKGWDGQVRLFYGAHTGMELLYMNDAKNDIGNYYDEDTFKAFTAISERPHLKRTVDVGGMLRENASEVWSLLQDEKTHVYVAGLEKEFQSLHEAMIGIAGSERNWREARENIGADGRWHEILY